jgi:hypothetical protein
LRHVNRHQRQLTYFEANPAASGSSIACSP